MRSGMKLAMTVAVVILALAANSIPLGDQTVERRPVAEPTVEELQQSVEFFNSKYTVTDPKWGRSLGTSLGDGFKAGMLKFALGVISLRTGLLDFINKIKDIFGMHPDVPMEAPRAAKTVYVPVGFDLANMDKLAASIAHLCAEGEAESKCIQPLKINMFGIGSTVTGYRVRDDFEARKAEIGRNLVLAEVLNRLSARAVDPELYVALIQAHENPAFTLADLDLSTTQRVHYKYKGEKVYTVPRLLELLDKDGHRVEVFTRHYLTSALAAFSQINAQGGFGKENLLDVPWPIIMKRTYYRAWWDYLGKDVMEAMIHSELHIDIAGPKVNGGVDWYTSNSEWTLFTDNVIYHYPKWLGCKKGRHYSGKEAVTAVNYASIFTELANDVGANLANGGYGRIGVCNDAVAFITKMMDDEVDIFVLLNHDKYFTRLSQRLEVLRADDAKLPAHQRLSAGYSDAQFARLHNAIATMPSDAEEELADQWARMLWSIPFPKGDVPFTWIDESREFLEKIVPADKRITSGEFCEF